MESQKSPRIKYSGEKLFFAVLHWQSQGPIRFGLMVLAVLVTLFLSASTSHNIIAIIFIAALGSHFISLIVSYFWFKKRGHTDQEWDSYMTEEYKTFKEGIDE